MYVVCLCSDFDWYYHLITILRLMRTYDAYLTYLCELTTFTLHKHIAQVKADPPSVGSEAGTPDYYKQHHAILYHTY